MQPRYFAVKSSRNWVEIRSHHKPPTKRVTTASRTTILTRKICDDWDWGYREVKTPVKINITRTIYTGGRVAGVLKARAFGQIFHIRLLRNQMVELTPQQVDLFKRRKEKQK